MGLAEVEARYPGIAFLAAHGHRPRGQWITPTEMYATFDKYTDSIIKLHVTEFGINRPRRRVYADHLPPRERPGSSRSIMMPLRSFVLTVFFGASLASAAAGADTLTIGSPAPTIDIEHWFHAKEPITSFEEGRVYVVEFWATWCGPCIASMPHLAEIQQRHADDVTVISVSDEDPEKIEKFLDREKGDTTFREITSGYWLTTDPDRSVSTAYMRAAGQSGIPAAFIVGKTGVIEWIGHPMRMDEPIAKVIAGEWDRVAFAAERDEEMMVRKRSAEISRLIQQNNFTEALAGFDSLISEVKVDRIRAGLVQGRQRVQMQAAAYADAKQREQERAARADKAQAETVSSLLEIAFLLKAGHTDEATAIIDRLIESSKSPQVTLLLEDARRKLASPEDGGNPDKQPSN
jgi:thiol-disulfide isomerase/thioredoxin